MAQFTGSEHVWDGWDDRLRKGMKLDSTYLPEWDKNPPTGGAAGETLNIKLFDNDSKYLGGDANDDKYDSPEEMQAFIQDLLDRGWPQESIDRVVSAIEGMEDDDPDAPNVDFRSPMDPNMDDDGGYDNPDQIPFDEPTPTEMSGGNVEGRVIPPWSTPGKSGPMIHEVPKPDTFTPPSHDPMPGWKPPEMTPEPKWKPPRRDMPIDNIDMLKKGLLRWRW